MMPPPTMQSLPATADAARFVSHAGAQPFAFPPAAGNLWSPGLAAAAAAPDPPPQQPPPTPPQSETGKPGFDLGFDPQAKAALPFDLPGQTEPESELTPAAPLPAPLLPTPLFPAPSFPAAAIPPMTFLAPSLPAATFVPSCGGQDFLQSVPAPPEEAAPPREPPKILHIRCPSGHLVTAPSDLLGKNGRCPACKKTFELRYEDSVEFHRRTEKILRREESRTAKTWIAWALLAAFLLFVGIVAMMITLSR